VGCHSSGQYQFTRRDAAVKAKNPQATHARILSGAVFHTYLVSCQSCHVTTQPLRALTILDMSTGQEQGYTVDNFDGAVWPADYLKPATKPWPPWQAREKKYLAAVPKDMQWFGERMTNGEIRPVPLHYVLTATRSVTNLTKLDVKLPDGQKEKRSTVVSDADILQMLKTLSHAGFRNVVYVSDQIYELRNGKLVSAPLKQSRLYYAVEHGVVATEKRSTYGWKGRSEGCRQCHDDASSFFAKKDIKNVRGFLKKDYPVLKEPNAAPQYEIWGLRSVPAFE